MKFLELFLNTLNSNISIFIITTAYTIITCKIYNYTKEKDETPDINIRLIKTDSTQHYGLLIENISKAEIYDLKFIKYPIINIFTDRRTDEIGFLKYGISYMGINQFYETLFVNALMFSQKEYPNIEFQMEYKDKKGRVFNKTININTSLIDKTGLIGTSYKDIFKKGFEDINQSLEDINESLNKNEEVAK